MRDEIPNIQRVVCFPACTEPRQDLATFIGPVGVRSADRPRPLPAAKRRPKNSIS